MVRNFRAYFSWNKNSLPSPSPSESRTQTPTPDDKSVRSVTPSLKAWGRSPHNPKEDAHRQQIISWRAEHNLGEDIVSPPQRRQGLDELQECFWIKDNLVRTDHQVTACSKRLDQMQDSAIRIRHELESIQAELAALVNRQRPRIDLESLRAQTREPVELPPLQLLLPDPPPAVDPALEAEQNEIPICSETSVPSESAEQNETSEQSGTGTTAKSESPPLEEIEVLARVATPLQAPAPVQAPRLVEPQQAAVPEKALSPSARAPAPVKPLSGRSKKVLDRFPLQASARPIMMQQRVPLQPLIKSAKVQERIQFWSTMQQV